MAAGNPDIPGPGLSKLNTSINKKFWPTQLLAALIFVPSFIVLCCTILGQTQLCVYFGCVQLEPSLFFVFLLTSVAIFFANPTVGAARIFTLPNIAGTMARRSCAGVLILVAALLPRHWLIEAGEKAGLVDASTVNILTAMVAVLALGVFGWWCFRKIDSEEKEKQQALQEKDRAIEQMQRGAESHDHRQYKLVCLTCMSEFTDDSLTNCPNDHAELVNIVDDFRPGSLFAQRYQIVKELGAGGMSTVYLAEHLLMNKQVAVKVLQQRLASDPKTIQRFQREAQTCSSLSHPNVVAVHDFNVTDQGQAYMVMEYLQGQSLSEFISDGALLPWQETLVLLHEVCDGLDHAHSKGIIHRDLKPGNIMLLPSCVPEKRFTPKIVDFGLAKILDEASVHLTHTGEIFGSPLYMSPEQCQGMALDHRSDIYSMGCIMYAALAGRAPYQGANLMETLMQHLQAPLPVLPPECGAPPWLQAIVHKAMAKDPQDRFQSISELAQALAEASGGSVTIAVKQKSLEH